MSKTLEILEEAGIDPETMEPKGDNETDKEVTEDGTDERLRLEQEHEPDAESDSSEDDGEQAGGLEEQSEEGGSEDEPTEADDKLSVDGIDFTNAPPDMKRAMRNKVKETTQLNKELKEQKGLLKSLIEKEQYIPVASPEKEQPHQEEIPDKELEPEDYAVYVAEKSAKATERMEQKQVVADTVQYARDALAESESATSIKDYKAAKAYGVQVIKNSIKRTAPDITPAEMNKAVAASLDEISAQAINRGVDVADHLYGMAQDYGYNASTTTTNDKGETPNLAVIEKNQNKNTKLGGAGGKVKGGKTLADLNEMSSKEYHDYKQANREEVNQLIDEATS